MGGLRQQAKEQLVLVFRRTGERRYVVEAQRPGFPDLEMNPAPGYDPLMPHDMMHMVVEAQLGLTRAIFGQLASGGTAGSFRLIVHRDEGSRAITRARNRLNARGTKLMKGTQDELMQSERATYICQHEWLARSLSREQRTRSESMAKQAREVRQTAGASELGSFSQRKLDEICEHLDELSSHWSSLRIGESMAVAWPSLAIVSSS